MARLSTTARRPTCGCGPLYRPPQPDRHKPITAGTTAHSGGQHDTLGGQPILRRAKSGQRLAKARTCNPLLTPAIEEAMDVLSHFRTDENLARMYENRLSVERIIAGNNMERDAALKRAEELE